jgi:hypothetical protein
MIITKKNDVHFVIPELMNSGTVHVEVSQDRKISTSMTPLYLYVLFLYSYNY